MKHLPSHCAVASRPVAAWVGAAILSLGALFGAANALAATPPANTLIGNQATASYLDSTGSNQLATSNLVQTQVQQVGAFTLDSVSSVTSIVVNTKTGAGGNVVYAAHTLTNTGNGTDNFSIVVTNGPNGAAGVMGVQVFLDANGDGLPDSATPLCTQASLGASCTVPAQAVAGSGGVFQFVVAYAIPAGAAASAPYSSGTVTATPATPALYATGNTSAADVDNVNVSTAAAFSATKSLSVPVVSGPGNTTYPAATQSGPRSPASCPTAPTYSNATTPGTGCVYSTYTIKFQNTGAAAGAFYLNDVLPAGFTYVSGSAVWSGASGVALSESGTGNPSGISYTQSGSTITAVIANMNASVSSSISFMVLVNSTATVGVGSTTNTATYDPTTSVKTTGPGSASTNPAAFTVIASFGVTLGGSTGAVGMAPASTDMTAGTPNGAFGIPSGDQNIVASIASGGSVKFTQKVFNTGNAADTFNMSVSTNSFPSGTVFTFYQADGVTPLLDTNSDGVVDTGSIGAGLSTSIVVQATIPASTAASATALTMIVRATSAGDSTKFDASGDQVTAVVGILVDLTNTTGGIGSGSVADGDLGAGPSPLPTTTSTTPAGTGVIFNLFIKNNDSIDQTYNLAASQTSSFPGSLPAGWTVKFVNAGTTCLGAAITTPVSVTTAVGQLAVDACVTPPTSAVAGTTNVYFRVTSATNASTGVIVSDTKTDAVTVTAAATYSATLTPNNNGQVSPGGTVVYAHTINNTGAQACGTYNLTATSSASGWTTAMFVDVNGNGIIDAGDTPVSNPSAAGLAVGASQKILVRVFAPGSATTGQQDTVVVTATFTGSAPNCGAPSATDVTTTVTGQIRVVKTQALDAACTGAPNGATAPATNVFSASLIPNGKPGQCVVYQVVATNEGTAAISNLSINDALPSYTTLSSAQPTATQCVASGITGTPVYASTGTTVSCGSAANPVPPGASLQLSFAVKINP